MPKRKVNRKKNWADAAYRLADSIYQLVPYVGFALVLYACQGKL